MPKKVTLDPSVEIEPIPTGAGGIVRGGTITASLRPFSYRAAGLKQCTRSLRMTGGLTSNGNRNLPDEQWLYTTGIGKLYGNTNS
jgi:hypothetical protein